MKKPSWTVLWNKDNGHWVSVSWEFFDTRETAKVRYDELANMPNHVPTLRPYYHSYDSQHLGACHSEQRKEPQTKLQNENAHMSSIIDKWTEEIKQDKSTIIKQRNENIKLREELHNKKCGHIGT